MTSEDIGVFESQTSPAGHSLQLIGTGSQYSDFTWAAARAESPEGSPNADQVFIAPGPDETAPVLVSEEVLEQDPAQAITVAFNERIQIDDATKIVLYPAEATADAAVQITAVVQGATLVVTPVDPLDPDTAYVLAIGDAAISDLAGNALAVSSIPVHTLDPDAAPVLTAIHAIQGAGSASPLTGQTVTVEAIVVGDFQSSDGDAKRDLQGFFLQAEAAEHDDNPLTSEGIFVFDGQALNGMDVNVGDRVMVTGVVGERFGKTQITAESVAVTQAGAVADISTMAADVSLPAVGAVAAGTGWVADLEAYEGMLVKFTDTLTITEQFDLDRYNEIKLVAGERPSQYTVDNAPDVAGYLQHVQELAARTIVYDDGLGVQNAAIGNLDGFDPYTTATAPRMGDTVDGLVGVLDYDFDQFRVRAVEDGSNTFDRVNERTQATEDVGGSLKMGNLNVLNYFRTLDIGSATTANGHDPRGADSAEEFARQTEKLVNALIAIDADVMGLIEMENDFEPGSPGNALEYLVQQLNARLPAEDQYGWVNPGQKHVGADAIANGFIYKVSTVKVAEGTSPAILNDATLAGLDGGQAWLNESAIGRIFDGENASRNPLAVTFEDIASGETFTAALNHFKSKGSADGAPGANADVGDGAGGWNHQRELTAKALLAWLETEPTQSSDPDIFILGDLNAYAAESPLAILAQGGFENLEDRLDAPYSYVFDGQTGTLDYTLATATAAAQVTGVAQWHINADEADALDYNLDFGRSPDVFDGDVVARVSDHDPMVIGLDLSSANTDIFTLQLLHWGDAEAGLLAGQTAPNMAALVDWFDDTYENTLILSGGDNFIPSPFMTAGADPSLVDVLGYSGLARPDIAIHNALGVQASVIGNHEWDLGSSVFADAISASGAFPGALFPYLSANLDFSGDSAIRDKVVDAGQNAEDIGGKIAASTVIEQGGEQIGLVGATTQRLLSLSSPNGTTVQGNPSGDDMALLAGQLQLEIDALREQGINKIILMAHLQDLANEKELAGLLSGVDIILAAGSHVAMGNDGNTPYPGREFAESYPFVAQDADGNNTLIVSTDGEYSYLGRLVVDFDADGNVVLDSLDPTVSGAFASTEATVEEVYGDRIEEAFADGSKGGQVREITDAVGAVVAEKDGTIYGYTNVYLEGDRAFGRGQEVNLGNLSADANAWVSQAAAQGEDAILLSIKNAGGIRASIGAVDGGGNKTAPIANDSLGKPAGGISQLDLENALRFDNKLMVFDTTAQGLLNILNGVSLNPGAGGFPQIGGFQFSYDRTLPAGQQIREVSVTDVAGVKHALVADGVVVAGAPATISVVTLSFVAGGSDGYKIPENGTNFRFVMQDGSLSDPVEDPTNTTIPDGALGEQKALADYLAEFHGTPDTAYDEADVPAALDERVQNLDARDSTVLEGTDMGGEPGQPEEPGVPGEPGENPGKVIVGDDNGGELVGTDGDDEITGGAGDDILVGGAGNDVLDGGAGGLDYAKFSGTLSDYTIVVGEDGFPISVSGPDGVNTLTNVERLWFEDTLVAFDVDGAAGQSYRLYEAAFDRAPDLGGVSYWTRALDGAEGDVTWLARGFLASDEFTQSFGQYQSLSNDAFIDLLYANVLGREAEDGGASYWLDALESGMARENLLASFSESGENRINLAGQTANGILLDVDTFFTM
nr:ExeM/NucH family extracellular endonuclease [Verticiella sp. GG226]